MIQTSFISLLKRKGVRERKGKIGRKARNCRIVYRLNCKLYNNRAFPALEALSLSNFLFFKNLNYLFLKHGKKNPPILNIHLFFNLNTHG